MVLLSSYVVNCGQKTEPVVMSCSSAEMSMLAVLHTSVTSAYPTLTLVWARINFPSVSEERLRLCL